MVLLSARPSATGWRLRSPGGTGEQTRISVLPSTRTPRLRNTRSSLFLPKSIFLSLLEGVWRKLGKLNSAGQVSGPGWEKVAEASIPDGHWEGSQCSESEQEELVSQRRVMLVTFTYPATH